MDRRRQRVAGQPGTLWTGQNVHITRGGDIERRKKFIPEYSVPGTFGVAALRNQLYTFGSADLASSMPLGVRYQRLQALSFLAMTKLLDVKPFAGKLYAIAEFACGNVYHYYDGNRVADWDTLATAAATYELMTTLLASKINENVAVKASSFSQTITIEALIPGTAFTIAQSTIDGGANPDELITLTQVQANVATVAEVRASADVTITSGSTGNIGSLTVNSVELLSAAIDWASSNSATAIRLAAAISNGYGTHGYSATALNDVVTIEAAPGTGATPNGYVVDVVTHGAIAVTADATLTGGVAEVEAVAQVYTAILSGTFQVNDTFVITVNGLAYTVTGISSGIGRSLYVDKNHMWSPVGSLEYYSKLDDAADWIDATAGSINVATEGDGNQPIIVAARYQNLAAFFSDSNIVLFQLDQDPANFAISNVLENTGTASPKAPVRYGNNDVFYLDQSGIRSLRARDASNAAFVSDVGNQIDTFLLEYLDGLTQEQISSAIGAIEPRDSRYWLIVGSRIFVLSYFPGAKISAWTYYDAEEFDDDPVQATARVRDRIFLRAGAFIYAYGGLAGTEYPDDDEAVALCELPFLSGNTPGTIKDLSGFDFAGTNTWECEIAFDADDPARTINAGRFDRITYTDTNKTALPGRTTMVSPVFTCRKAGPATISMATVHYEVEGEKT